MNVRARRHEVMSRPCLVSQTERFVAKVLLPVPPFSPPNSTITLIYLDLD